jgi:Family of unknown function (DUF5749)
MISYLSLVMFPLGLFNGVFFFRKKEESTDLGKPTESVESSMLCKFVFDGTGKKIGESVSIDNDVLIIKSGVRFLGVPLKHVESLEKTLMVKGLLDFTKAYELGEKWRKDSSREMKQHGRPDEKSE